MRYWDLISYYRPFWAAAFLKCSHAINTRINWTFLANLLLFFVLLAFCFHPFTLGYLYECYHQLTDRLKRIHVCSYFSFFNYFMGMSVIPLNCFGVSISTFLKYLSWKPCVLSKSLLKHLIKTLCRSWFFPMML